MMTWVWFMALAIHYSTFRQIRLIPFVARLRMTCEKKSESILSLPVACHLIKISKTSYPKHLTITETSRSLAHRESHKALWLKAQTKAIPTREAVSGYRLSLWLQWTHKNCWSSS